MGRSHAWIRRGYELLDPRPMNWGTNLTMIGAVRIAGWVTLGTMFKSANADRFVHWVRYRLSPKLRKGDVVLLDNAKAHKDPRVATIVQSRGARLEFLPPYSPDLNPIEPAWSLVKKAIRAAAPRVAGALRRIARSARHRVRRSHLLQWFRHSGYDHRLK
jgi:transposase